MTTLNAEIRDLGQKNLAVRAGGNVPAVFYGFKKDATSLVIKKIDFIKVFKEVGETNTLTLQTPNGAFDALIHEVQHDPITNEPIHVDFLAVDMTKEIEVDVPFEFIGEAPATKSGGVLVKVMHEVKVSALPNKIPHNIEVDLSKLEAMDSVIAIKDLNIPSGVRVLDEADATVASITVAKEEVENAPAPDLSTIEVEAKGKKEVEGEEAGGA